MRTFSTLYLLFLIPFLPGTLLSQEWTLQSTGSSGEIRDVAFFDDRNGVAAVWVLPGSSEILHTSDGGANWTTTYSNINEGMTGAAWPSINSPVIVGGTFNFGRAYLSGNMGTTWDRVLDDPRPKPSFWSVDFPNEMRGYAGGGSRTIFTTSDGGLNWEALSKTVGSGPGQVIALDFLSVDVGWAVLTTSATDFTNGSLLYSTVDGGESWTEVREFFVARSVHFVDDRTGYVTGSDGSGPVVWQTTDGGTSWQPTRLTTSSGLYLNDVDFAEDNRYIGYVAGGDIFDGSDGILASTTDGGATWVVEKEDLPVALFAIDVPAQGAIFASGTSGVVYRTGREWVEEPEPVSEVSSEEIDFGTIILGEQKVATVRLRAKNVAGLQVDSIYLNEPIIESNGLSLTVDRALPTRILGIDSLEITLRAAPTDTGYIFGLLRVVTSDAQEPIREIPITGTIREEVTVEPVAMIDRTAIDFDSVTVGDSATASFTVTAGGSAGLTIFEMNLGSQGDYFRVMSTPPLPAELAGGERITFDVTFAPVDSGRQTAGVVVTTNAPSSPALTVTLEGIGRPVPKDTSALVTHTERGFSLSIAPNPTTDRVAVDLNLEHPGSVVLRLYDLSGRLLATTEPSPRTSGPSMHSLAVPNGVVGLCLVEVVVDGEVVGRGKVEVR